MPVTAPAAPTARPPRTRPPRCRWPVSSTRSPGRRTARSTHDCGQPLQQRHPARDRRRRWRRPSRSAGRDGRRAGPCQPPFQWLAQRLPGAGRIDAQPVHALDRGRQVPEHRAQAIRRSRPRAARPPRARCSVMHTSMTIRCQPMRAPAMPSWPRTSVSHSTSTSIPPMPTSEARPPLPIAHRQAGHDARAHHLRRGAARFPCRPSSTD